MSEREKAPRRTEDEPDVEAHNFGRGRGRNDDAQVEPEDKDDDQPDVEAHRFRPT